MRREGGPLLSCWVRGGSPGSAHILLSLGSGGLPSLASGRDEHPDSLLSLLWYVSHYPPHCQKWVGVPRDCLDRVELKTLHLVFACVGKGFIETNALRFLLYA